MKNIRLEKIADMVEKGVTAADIGTDHALLPIMLVNGHICKKVYACDVAEGPLQAAHANIHKAGLDDCIPTILSNGLQNVPLDADACVIAGMGCMTAVSILNDAGTRLNELKQIIVEVNRDTIKMREWISEHQYTITDEIYVNDRGHDYIAIAFRPEHHDVYDRKQIVLGPVLAEKREPEYLAYCARQIKKIDRNLMESKGNPFQKESIEAELLIYQNYLKQ
jgi:tRNA (adenine22-N1)-methyltransferase